MPNNSVLWSSVVGVIINDYNATGDVGIYSERIEFILSELTYFFSLHLLELKIYKTPNELRDFENDLDKERKNLVLEHMELIKKLGKCLSNIGSYEDVEHLQETLSNYELFIKEKKIFEISELVESVWTKLSGESESSNEFKGEGSSTVSPIEGVRTATGTEWNKPVVSSTVPEGNHYRKPYSRH